MGFIDKCSTEIRLNRNVIFMNNNDSYTYKYATQKKWIVTVEDKLWSQYFDRIFIGRILSDIACRMLKNNHNFT